jgi:hypothetical protein
VKLAPLIVAVVLGIAALLGLRAIVAHRAGDGVKGFVDLAIRGLEGAVKELETTDCFIQRDRTTNLFEASSLSDFAKARSTC